MQRWVLYAYSACVRGLLAREKARSVTSTVAGDGSSRRSSRSFAPRASFLLFFCVCECTEYLLPAVVLLVSEEEEALVVRLLSVRYEKAPDVRREIK